MPRECLNCEQGVLRHAVKDVPYEYKGHATVVPKIAGLSFPLFFVFQPNGIMPPISAHAEC